MMSAVEERAAVAVHHVRPVAPEAADGLVAEVYAQVRTDLILAAPFTLHSPVPEILGV